MKKTISLILSAVMLMGVLAACSQPEPTPTPTPNPGTSQTNPGSSGTGSELTPLSAGLCEAPIVLTSVGQSSDMDIINTLCGRGSIDVYANNLITADALSDQYKTLILAVGGSSKGLGAAGIDDTEELARAEALIEKAQSLGMKILTIHAGGSARRGNLSDKFITPAFQAADLAIVVSEGDSDNFMRDIITGKGIPADYVETAADVLNSLKTLFG